MNELTNLLPVEVLNHLNLIMTDKENKIKFVSQHYADTLGYTLEEVIGKSPVIFRHPSVSKLSIMPELHTHNHWNGIVKNLNKNTGKALYFNANIYKDFDSDGNHIGFHSIHTDITKTITDPHRFIFDNDLLEIFFTNINDLIAICLCATEKHSKHRIIEISDDLVKLTKFSKSDIIENELAFTDIISEKSKYYNDFELLLEDLSNNSDIVLTFCAHDTTSKYKLTATPFTFQGQLARIFKLTNVTKEIIYAEQLNEVITSKNQFLANLSHEIKTPLNAINGFLTLLQLRETDKEKLNYINIMLSSSKHILELANDVIDISSIDNNKLEIVPREFTSRDIQSTIEVFFAKSLEKNIDFTTYISPQLPEIMFQDILRLKQVITNLISNAIKFADIGGIISIDCHYYRDNLHFIIKDNGIGMTEDQIGRIFNPFTQASKDTKMFFGGTGLGLSVVKKIIELMGGSITVESKIGVGSTFSTIVPVRAIKEHNIAGKININNISIFAPSFSHNKIDIIKKYLIHFSSAKIHKISKLNKPRTDCLIVNLGDVNDIEVIKEISNSTKVILIKNMNEITHDFDKNPNVTELNLPILGSKLYDALQLVINNCTSTAVDSLLDLHVKGKILIAEDLESNRFLIKELLSSYDIELNFAVDGLKAFELFKNSIKNNKSGFDLIFLDMNMPILTGSKVAEKIRDFENQLNIERTPLVALTADRYSLKNDERLIHMDEYLPKPINIKQLLSTIIKYTSNLKAISEDHIGINKISKLKEVRDEFLNNRKLNSLVLSLRSHFNDDEFIILKEIANISHDKRKFNTLYNHLMKMVRKNY